MMLPAGTSTFRIVLVFAAAANADLARAQAPPSGAPPIVRQVSIDAALEMALASSDTLLASTATSEAARAQVLSARSAYFPHIDANASYLRTIRSEFDDIFEAPGGVGGEAFADLPFGRKNTWRVGLRGSQLIWSGGRVESAVRLAQATATGAGVQTESVRAQVVLAAAQAYYDVALAQRLVEISEATLGQAEETLRHTSLSFEQGVRPELDVLRAEVTRDNERTNVTNARSQLRVTTARLRRLLGLPPGVSVVLTSALEAGDLDLVDRAAQRGAGIVTGATRAPIREAGAFVDARRAELGLERAERFPSFALTSDLGFVNYPQDVWFDREGESWHTNFTVMVVASFPLFTGFRRTAEIRAARAMVAASRARLAETMEISRVDELEVGEQVDVAQATYRQSGRTVEQAARAYEQAFVRYREGVATQLDVVDSRVLLQRARVNQARAMHDLRSARIRRTLLPALPLTLPTTFVLTTPAGTPAIPVPGAVEETPGTLVTPQTPSRPAILPGTQDDPQRLR